VLGEAAHAVETTLKPDDASKTSARLAPLVAEIPQTPATELEATTSGLLTVFSRVPLELYIAGRRMGTTEDGQLILAPGRYKVGLVSTRLHYRGEATLDIQPGALTSYSVPLPNGLLQLDTEPGAEVWIEGKRVGVAPLRPQSVPIGTREIVCRHPDFGERREVVEVRYGEVTAVSVPLREELR
jgi:hypothetical protein